MPLTADDIPHEQPAGLRLSSLDVAWWRLDRQQPADWSWQPFRTVRNRFDPADGSARVRYAARTERGAFRERYAELRRLVEAEEASTSVVRLAGRVRVLDLRRESVLDALHLDDEISTSRDPRVWAACGVLAGRLRGWYAGRLYGVVYRSRTTPATSANLAFYANAPLTATVVGALADRVGLLAELVADDGFRLELPGWR